MAYDPNKPVTTGNCPTREALERTPQSPGFRQESIHARHTDKQRQQHLQNLAARGSGKGKKS